MLKIYVVQGTTGEYSDHRDWFVKAFAQEQAAKDLVCYLESEVLRLGVKYDTEQTDWDKRRAVEEEMRKIDPEFELAYTGTRYFYSEVEFIPWK